MSEHLSHNSEIPEEAQPENFDYEEKKSKRTIRVERIEDYYNPPPDDFDEQMEKWMTEEYEKYLAEYGELPEEEKPLPYEPFDARVELVKIRKLSQEEQSLSKQEKRKIRKQRLEEFKTELNAQKIGIGRTIKELHEIIEANPDISEDVLALKIETASNDFRLTKRQISNFEFATDEYRKKHKAVEKYRALYSNDDDLFEACFGQKPKGKVEVEKGAMTLLFRCFDEGDYAYVYNLDRIADGKENPEQEKIREANNTGGIALGRVKIEELTGAITVENARYSKNYELLKAVPKTEQLTKGGNLTLSILDQKKDIEIETEDGGSWEIKLLEPDDLGFFNRMQLVSKTESSQPLIFDFVRIKPSEETHWMSFVREVGDAEQKNYVNTIGNLKFGNKYCGLVDVDAFDIKITNSSGQIMTIEYAEDEVNITFAKDKSKGTQVHEDQHQFNRLFSPYENSRAMLDIMQRAVERTDDPEKATDYVIHDLVRWNRKNIVDDRARDEMLAFYKEGRSPEDILKILSDSELYNYVNQKYTKEQLALIPKTIKEDIKKEMLEEIYYEDSEFGGASELEIDEERVKPHIALVFGEEYKADLKKWSDALSVLEQKGYTREEVVSLLYQEPVNSWANFAKRLKVKNK